MVQRSRRREGEQTPKFLDLVITNNEKRLDNTVYNKLVTTEYSIYPGYIPNLKQVLIYSCLHYTLYMYNRQ